MLNASNDWVWLTLYIFVTFLTPIRVRQKGYIWRLVRKIPPWRFFRGEGAAAALVRLLLLWLPWRLFVDLVLSPSKDGEAKHNVLYWTPIIISMLDDYVNGDDDRRKKRWAALKNKVRWLWTPAREPSLVRPK